MKLTIHISCCCLLWTYSDISLLFYPLVYIFVDELILSLHLDHAVSLFSKSADDAKIDVVLVGVVDGRQFELGVMRMVGFTRTNLVLYIVTGASLFAVPALVVGLVTGQVRCVP